MRQPSRKIKWPIISLLSVVLLLALPAKAQISAEETGKFRRIEQPLGIKLSVAAVGAGLVGLELWWFLAKE